MNGEVLHIGCMDGETDGQAAQFRWAAYKLEYLIPHLHAHFFLLPGSIYISTYINEIHCIQLSMLYHCIFNSQNFCSTSYPCHNLKKNDNGKYTDIFKYIYVMHTYGIFMVVPDC